MNVILLKIRLNNSHKTFAIGARNWEHLWDRVRDSFNLSPTVDLELLTAKGELITTDKGVFSRNPDWKNLNHWVDVIIYVSRMGDKFKPKGYKCMNCGSKTRNHDCYEGRPLYACLSVFR